MNSVTLRPVTMWAILLMEAAAAVPILAKPAAGPGVFDIAGPILTALFLPLGYLAERWLPMLRTQNRRLGVGIGLAVALRLIVAPPQDAEARSLAVWLLFAFVPAALSLGLWWRGLVLGTAEVTAADVRNELALLGGSLLALVTLFRAVVRTEPALLLGPLVVFLAAGLVALSLARQDAARVSGQATSRSVAVTTSAAPQVAAVLVVGVLSPGVLGAVWAGLATLLAVLLAPLFALLAWLASLFPAGTAGAPPVLREPAPPPLPPEALLENPGPPAWLGLLVLLAVAVILGLAVLALARVLLGWRPRARRRAARRKPDDGPTVVGTGGAGRDLRALWRWLLSRLLLWVGSPGAPAAAGQAGRGKSGASDARAAYRVLLEWATRQGIPRRPPETTHQLERRLTGHLPARADTFNLVTRVYEWDRYGGRPPSRARLAEVERSLEDLAE